MIDLIDNISLDMQLLQELFSNGNQINLLLFTYPIMFGLMNIVLTSPKKTKKLQVPYYLGKIMDIIFMSQTSSTWFHVNLIIHAIYLVTQQWSHMKLSYLPLGRKLVLIYWMMKNLQYHTSLIQYQINQLVIYFHHRVREMCGS